MHSINSTRNETTSECNVLPDNIKYWVKDICEDKLSNNILKRCLSYAIRRIKVLPIDFSKIDNILFERPSTNKVTISFRGSYAAIKVNSIMLGSTGWPMLDHGITFDENDMI